MNNFLNRLREWVIFERVYPLLSTSLRKIRVYRQSFLDSRVALVLDETVQITSDNKCVIELGNLIQGYSRIRLDIGLSHNAPNTAKWTSEDNGVFVVGVEANRFNVARLTKKGVWSKNNPSKPVKAFKPRNLKVLHVALDDVEIPCFSRFHNMVGDSGTSSLLEPTGVLKANYGYSVGSVEMVPTISLAELMSRLPWEKIEFVELCKIDAQGKDLDIIRSAGEYLSRIAVLVVEVETFGQYKGAPGRGEIYELLSTKGFHPVLPDQEGSKCESSDVTFVNERLSDEAKSVLTSI